MVVFKGLVGVGKSALSRALGKRLNWPVVDKDDFSDVLMAHLEHYGPLAYESMFSVAESLLGQGFNVICDSPLRGVVGYERAAKLARDSGAELRVVRCSLADEALWQTRLETRRRRPAHILKTWADLARYRRHALADFDYPVKAPGLTVDMAAPLEELTEKVIWWLEHPRGVQ